MTEPNDAEVGKIMREHKETLAAIAKLEADALKMGTKLSEMGGLLVRSPQELYFQDNKNSTDHKPSPYTYADLDAAKIHELCKDYRKRLNEKFEFEDRLKELGYPVPLG
jgi:hypothetical protein